MAGFPSLYDKSKVKLSDFVDQFCSHRADCTVVMCALRPEADMPEIKDKKDIAYRDGRHCERFRPTDGGLPEADIIETGVWK